MKGFLWNIMCQSFIKILDARPGETKTEHRYICHLSSEVFFFPLGLIDKTAQFSAHICLARFPSPHLHLPSSTQLLLTSPIFAYIWLFLPIFACIWLYLAIFGYICLYLPVFAYIWLYLPIFELSSPTFAFIHPAATDLTYICLCKPCLYSFIGLAD